jgi:hypothetical protein
LSGLRVVKLRERIEVFRILNLADGDIESQRVAFAIRAEADFGREATTPATERFLNLIPLLAPAVAPRTMVVSTVCSPRPATASHPAASLAYAPPVSQCR